MDFNDVLKTTKSEAIKRIKDIISCKSAHIPITNKDFDALELAIKALEAQGWIPVSERLPDKYGRYIVTEKVFAIDDRNHRGKFKVETEQVEFYDGKWNRAKFFEVIAWQPLPEPYTKEETT